MKNIFLFFFVLFLLESNSQIKNMDFNTFFLQESLDKKISLGENFDYKLVSLGVMFYTNKHRYNKYKHVLNYSEILEKSARIHSLEMKKHNFFAHINKLNKELRDIDDRANYVNYNNYKELAENIYYGFVDLRNLPTYRDLISTITKAFIHSKSHNENLLNKRVEQMGCYLVFEDKNKDGFLHYYFTQSLGSQFK